MVEIRSLPVPHLAKASWGVYRNDEQIGSICEYRKATLFQSGSYEAKLVDAREVPGMFSSKEQAAGAIEARYLAEHDGLH